MTFGVGCMLDLLLYIFPIFEGFNLDNCSHLNINNAFVCIHVLINLTETKAKYFCMLFVLCTEQGVSEDVCTLYQTSSNISLLGLVFICVKTFFDFFWQLAMHKDEIDIVSIEVILSLTVQ